MNNGNTNEKLTEGKKNNKRRPYYNKKRHKKPNPAQDQTAAEQVSVESSTEQGTPKADQNQHRSEHNKGHQNQPRNDQRNEKRDSTAPKNDNVAPLSDIAFEDDMTPSVTVSIENEDDVKKINVTGVRFKPNGKIYYFNRGDVELKDGGYVIVDTARGLEFGEVAFSELEVKAQHRS